MSRVSKPNDRQYLSWGGYGKRRLEKMNGLLLPRSSTCRGGSASWPDAMTSGCLCAFIFMSLEQLG